MTKELLKNQRSEKQYILRINGVHLRFYDEIDKAALEDFYAIAQDHPKDYVDIVCVYTEIVFSNYSHWLMEKNLSSRCETKTPGVRER